MKQLLRARSKETTGWLAVLAVAWGAMFLSAGCSRGPARVLPPSIDAPSAGEAAIAQYDADHDGTIAGNECDKAPALKAALAQVDRDGDGKITADEITARIRQWQQSRLGLTAVTCQVRLDGRPLADATVTFVPEAFLGPSVQRASGKTDANGIASLSVENPPEPGLMGVAPGFYRVEISRKQGGAEIIPPRYNTETILGQEVALDAKGMDEAGITFELTSR